MVKIRSLAKEKFGPSINIIIITVRNFTRMKNSGRGRVISPIFFRNYSININIVKNYFLGNRNLALNWLEMDGFGLCQNIGTIGKVFLGIFKTLVEIWGKIREG